MSIVWAICFKELKSFFYSPLSYVLGGVFSIIVGWIAYNYLVFASQNQVASLSSAVLRPVFGNINTLLLLLTPILTMRIFAEEKRSQSIVVLLTSPITNWQIVLGKYLASVLIVMFFLALTSFFPVILYFSHFSNWPQLALGYLGLSLTAWVYVAVGLMASSLTDNQLVAAFLTFCFLFGVLLLAITSSLVSNPFVAHIFNYSSFAFHFESFIRGGIINYNIAYFTSFIVLALYIAERAIDARNW